MTSAFIPLAFETWPIDRLIEYARNPRKNDHAVDRVAAAIREFGFRVPIVAKSDGLVVDGHLRLKAAKKLGLAEVPVILADDMTDAQVKAFRLSVNKVAELAEWDDELLRLEFDDLSEMGFDLTPIGFDADEIAAIQFDSDSETEMPDLEDGDREPFQQMTFTLHDDQAEEVKAAIEKAKAMGAFVNTGNENGNGNALARVCEVFNGLR
jgi:ParB-like chromosome segregation protein Spo0J